MNEPCPRPSSESALCERVKELTCLYRIAQLAARPDLSLEEVLQSIAEAIPPAWQYPEISEARILLDGREFRTNGFFECPQSQRAEIRIADRLRGSVQVIYSEEKPILDDGPFLLEERKLIDAVAGQVSLIVQRREAEQINRRLQGQLRHADRLATIGLLAAGVAHELNEPLGTILGFAQLIEKSENLSDQVRNDIEKIESASLHAREVIRNLLVFARQVPPHKTRVNLNHVVDQGLYFLESRCAKDGIEVNRLTDPDLADIVADPAQLQQVLINLVVNALQAMPNGGNLLVETRGEPDHVSLSVEDTGFGMTEDVLEDIFIPFFTTKEAGEGTGLGLPVVHGIVTSHGGTITVESRAGSGTRFEVRLPIGPAAQFIQETADAGTR